MNKLDSTQTAPVRDAANEALNAERRSANYKLALKLLLFAAIAVSVPNARVFGLVAMTGMFDAFLSFLLIDGSLPEGIAGSTLTVVLCLTLAMAAIGLEVISANLARSSHTFRRLVSPVIGLIPAVAIVYVVGIFREQLAMLTDGEASGLDAKLVVAGAFAVGGHLLLLLCGSDIGGASRWAWLKLNIMWMRSRLAASLSDFTTHAAAALQLAHSLSLQAAALGVVVEFDPVTAASIERWQRELTETGWIRPRLDHPDDPADYGPEGMLQVSTLPPSAPSSIRQLPPKRD